MKLAVVSDIHGNLPALLAVVADAQNHGSVDGWLNLGDILSGPLWPAQTADWLMQRDWPTIAGNHERQVLTQAFDRMSLTDRHTVTCLRPEHRRWMAALPATIAPAPGLLCVHGTPHSDAVYLLETVTAEGMRAATGEEIEPRLNGVRCELLLCGHSHLPRDAGVAGMRIANPGSVGLQAYDDGHPVFHVAETGSPHARYAVVERTPAGWQLQLRQVAYDWQAAAEQAARNGRADWAHALLTGRVGPTEAQAEAG